MKNIYVLIIHYALLIGAIFGIKYYTETPKINCGVVSSASSSYQALYIIADDGCKEKVSVSEETYNKYRYKHGERICFTTNICDHASFIMFLATIFFIYLICGFGIGLGEHLSNGDDTVLNFMKDAFNFFKYLKI